jgi:hypothetical protein
MRSLSFAIIAASPKPLKFPCQFLERFFNKLKQFRRLATRYDKLLDNFMGFVKLAAIAIWLK